MLKKAIRVTRQEREEQELWDTFMDGVAIQQEDPEEKERRLKIQAEADQEDEFRRNRGGNAVIPDDTSSSGRAKFGVDEEHAKEDDGMAKKGGGKGQASTSYTEFL